MNTIGFIADIRRGIEAIVDFGWRVFAAVLDVVVALSPLQSAMLFAGMALVIVIGASAQQRYVNGQLEDDADREVNPLVLEARYSLPGYLFRFLRFIVMLPVIIVRAILDVFSDGDEPESDDEEPPPLLVPTLGPSYLWAALFAAGLAVLAVVAEPLIRWQLELPSHFPTWQYLIFGHRLELGPYLPLGNHPFAGALVIGAFWLAIWSTAARVVRLWRWDNMGRNLIDGADDPDLLSSWRTHFGATDLANRNDSFDAWAKWLPIAAIPLLVLAFFSIGAEPYRIGATWFSVAFIAWMSWAIHLRLEGIYRPAPPDEQPEDDDPVEAVAPGWEHVLGDLKRVHDMDVPAPIAEGRDVESLAFSEHAIDDGELISPLIGELLPEPTRLTAMQHDVLSTLSRHSFVHLDPPGDSRTLDLGGAKSTDPGMRHRNQIVMAPEGTGKTALAMLAGFNTALIHASSSLIVVRNEEQAARLAQRMRNTVQPSTLRWNLRIRRIGDDLVDDLASGIIPDVLVCDLESLVTSLLDDVETFRRFLMNLGVIIIDDLETLCGPVEVHAQLAFRRLDLRLRDLRGVDEIGEEQAPIFLMLASDTMDSLPAWARSLCGVDAVPRRFASQQATRRRELAQRARDQVQSGGRNQPVVGSDVDDSQTGDGRQRRQFVYDIDDFVDGDGQPLSVVDLVEACEALAVPWHYRTAGDDRRLLGRSVLPVRNEPQAHVDDPLEAAVVIVDGHATAVEREVDRLGRAGAHFTSEFVPGGGGDVDDASPEDEVESDAVEPIAIVTVVDADERTLIDSVDRGSALADVTLALPRPFLRPPSGYLTRRHLTSELIQHWTEVADLLDVFGNDIASLLRRLTERGAVLTEQRTNLERGETRYEHHVYVRGLEAELYDGEAHSADEERSVLPPPVEDVEVASQSHIAVRERSTLGELLRVDAESARHRFYPGRIFETSRGRHMVVEYADGDTAKSEGYEVGDVIAEPFLGTEITSPRRDVRVELVAGTGQSMTPEPVYLGPAPVGVGHFTVRCTVEHRATFRLDARTGEIRQRIYRPESERRAVTFRTDAVGIHPNLEPEDGPAPQLTVGASRLVAAALRVVTPLVYRGADAAIGIGLHVDADGPEDTDDLESTDGVFLYDLNGGSNGAARAIARDGVDALLRLARHLLEQLDDHRRLLNTHDHWDGELDADARQEAVDGALAWFDGRLGRSRSVEEGDESEQTGEIEVSDDEGAP